MILIILVCNVCVSVCLLRAGKHPRCRDLERLSIIYLFLLGVYHPWPSFQTDASFIYAFCFFKPENIKYQCGSIVYCNFSQYLFIFALNESQFLPMANWRSCWQSRQSFICIVVERVKEWQTPGSGPNRTFQPWLFRERCVWTLPTLHCTTNAAVTLTWADLGKDNPF